MPPCTTPRVSARTAPRHSPITARTLDSVRMEQDLRHALKEGWFVVHYQPKFTAGGYLAGMEALIRLNHPRHGQILPGQFIPIAEASELIVPIGAWVISEVCRQIAELAGAQLRARGSRGECVGGADLARRISRNPWRHCLLAHWSSARLSGTGSDRKHARECGKRRASPDAIAARTRRFGFYRRFRNRLLISELSPPSECRRGQARSLVRADHRDRSAARSIWCAL